MRYRLLVVAAACAIATPLSAQPPWKGKNLQFFPKDISRPELTQRMREFAFALNVRCQYCHAGGDGTSFDGVDFAADDKPAKVKARAMLRMMADINGTMLPRIPSRAEPRVEVTCATCHRGLALPKSLQTTLFEIVAAEGVEAAVTRYKEWRKDTTRGLYDFGPWEVMELARRLVEAKNTSAAIAILEMNGEYYPKSPEIDYQIAELHRMRGETDKALARYKIVLDKAPNYPGVKERIAALEKQ
jgi:Photosynthetic reaction centre cytochrome C subunit